MVALRWRVAAVLTTVMVVVYFGFILAVAFAKTTMGAGIVPGLSVGIALGAGVIVTAWVLTGVYVFWANRVYDPAVRELREASRARSAEGRG